MIPIDRAGSRLLLLSLLFALVQGCGSSNAPDDSTENKYVRSFTALEFYEQEDDIVFYYLGDSDDVPVVGVLVNGYRNTLSGGPNQRSASNPRSARSRGIPVEFESLDPAIATVDEHGWVTAVGCGETRIEVRLGELAVSVPVRSCVSNRGPKADAGPVQRCVQHGSWIVMEGTARDQDDRPGGPLLVEWVPHRPEDDLPFEWTPGPRLGLVVPDIPEFRLDFRAFDGQAEARSTAIVLVDQDGDGFCRTLRSDGYDLAVEPFVEPAGVASR